MEDDENDYDSNIVSTCRCANIIQYVDNLDDYAQRSEKYLIDEGNKFVEVNDHLISRCTFQVCGRGSFKRAYKMINGHEWVFKIILEDIPEYRLNSRLRYLITINETILQQMACVIFYEMKSKLNQKLNDDRRIKMKFQRPINCGSDIKISNDAFQYENKYHYIVETLLIGEFQKYILQNGKNTKRNKNICKLANTLMHYSYVMTNGYLCMADIQGTEDAFTDVCFNTRRGDSGLADAGNEGLKSCTVYHNCNDYCKLLEIDNEKNETTLSQLYLSKRNRTSALYDVFKINKETKYIPFNSNFATDETSKIMKNDSKIYSNNYMNKGR